MPRLTKEQAEELLAGYAEAVKELRSQILSEYEGTRSGEEGIRDVREHEERIARMRSILDGTESPAHVGTPKPFLWYENRWGYWSAAKKTFREKYPASVVPEDVLTAMAGEADAANYYDVKDRKINCVQFPSRERAVEALERHCGGGRGR